MVYNLLMLQQNPEDTPAPPLYTYFIHAVAVVIYRRGFGFADSDSMALTHELSL
jgi:hypothetical protein